MKNKKLAIIFSIFIFYSLISSLSAAFFWPHTYFDLKSIEGSSGPIAQLCGTPENLKYFLDGNKGSDATVTHYTDDKFLSYVFSHVRNGYNECLKEAGNDVELQCQCHGEAAHIIEDWHFHGPEGLVPKYLSQAKAPNLVGHMGIERSHEDKLKLWLNEINEPLVISGTVDMWDSRTYEIFFEEGSEKHVNLLNSVTGIDATNDIAIVGQGYRGEGNFFNTIYNQRISLPSEFWIYSSIAIILGLLVTIILLYTGKTVWKWLAIIPWVTLTALGILVLVSIFTNNTWEWVQSLLRIYVAIEIFTLLGLLMIITGIIVGLTSFSKDGFSKSTIILSLVFLIFGIILILLPIIGIVNSSSLTVSRQDVITNHDAVIRDVKRFLDTGNLVFDDASGLSYKDRNGQFVEGALIKAESQFKFILLPLLAIMFSLLNSFLIYKTYSRKKQSK